LSPVRALVGPLDATAARAAPAAEAALVVSGFVVGRLVEVERQEGDGAAYVALRGVPPDALRLLLSEAIHALS